MRQKTILTSRKELERYQLLELRKLIRKVLKTNTFYKEKFSKYGIHSIQQIKTLRDLKKLPFTTKKELVDDQRDNPPLGTNLTRDILDYYYVKSTSGTGRVGVLRVPFTQDDIDRRTALSIAFEKAVSEIQEGEIRTDLGNPATLYYLIPQYRELGQVFYDLTFPAATSLECLKKIIDYKVNVIRGTVTELINIVNAAKDNNIDLKRDTSVRVINMSGEAESGFESVRKEMEKIWGAECSQGYGGSELGKVGKECKNKNGVHLNEGMIIFEVIDPETGKSSHEGEMVITSLWAHDFPMIRYKTGDYIKIVGDRCGCGVNYYRIDSEDKGRVEHNALINNKRLMFVEIQKAIRNDIGLRAYFGYIKQRRGRDIFELYMEASLPDDYPVIRKVRRSLTKMLNMKPKIILKEVRSLPISRVKTTRIVDLRHLRRETNYLAFPKNNLIADVLKKVWVEYRMKVRYIKLELGFFLMNSKYIKKT